MFEPEWNVDINTEDTIMLGLRKKSQKNQLTYLENKAKIKALLSEVGYEHILTYMIEDLDRYDILGNEDLWVLRMAESLEDAYNVLIGKYKDEDNIDSKVTPNEN
jgi:hypothetical protein